MTEREPSPAAKEKAQGLHHGAGVCWGDSACPACLRIALALDDFAAQRERAGLEKAAEHMERYGDVLAGMAIRALMVEPSEKETGR